MKSYPPRTHNKRNRISKAEWPKRLWHGRVSEPPTKWRPIKGLLIRNG